MSEHPAQPQTAAESSDDDDAGPAPPPAVGAPEGDSSDGDVGPAAPRPRKRRRRELPGAAAYVEALPCADMYEKSYMHRDTVRGSCPAIAESEREKERQGHLLRRRVWRLAAGRVPRVGGFGGAARVRQPVMSHAFAAHAVRRLGQSATHPAQGAKMHLGLAALALTQALSLRLSHRTVSLARACCAAAARHAQVLHVATTRSDFVLTASADGHLKFWKKVAGGVEFVKHFRAHANAVEELAVAADGALAATLSDDGTVKVFDVSAFDMTAMLRLGYTGGAAAWVHSANAPSPRLAVADRASPAVRIYEPHAEGVAKGGNAVPVLELPSVHTAPVCAMRFNAAKQCVVSGDRRGVIEYWSPATGRLPPPPAVRFQFKSETDLYTMAKVCSGCHPGVGGHRGGNYN